MDASKERPSSPQETAFYMDAVLTPHRSLSLKAYRWMLVAVVAVNLIVALYFITHGAYPVAGFLGLDVLAIWLAFRINYRAARTEERVQVSREEVRVSRRDPKGATRHWSVKALWARVRPDSAGVVIDAGRSRLRVASFLSPAERADFAKALDTALWRAKRG